MTKNVTLSRLRVPNTLLMPVTLAPASLASLDAGILMAALCVVPLLRRTPSVRLKSPFV